MLRTAETCIGIVLSVSFLLLAATRLGATDMTSAPDVVELWPHGSANSAGEARPFLEIFRPFTSQPSARATIIVIPGGGFAGLSPQERLSAEFFRSLGYAAVVLHYRVSPHRHPAPFADAARAVRLVRSRAVEWGIPGEQVALFGGSAGGHLAAMIATQPELYRDPEDDLAATVSARPDRVILLYPVISAIEPFAYVSFHRLLGENASTELKQMASPELHVSGRTPPALLIHAADDTVVKVENSIAFAQACWRVGVPAELHVFSRGGHGKAFAYDPEISPRWRALVQDWLARWLAERSDRR